MHLYIDAETNVNHAEDLAIDYIEVQLKNGKSVSLNWDESDFAIVNGQVFSTYKGVYFDEEYADGMIQELEGMKITEVGFYTESDKPLDFIITNIQVEDYDKELSFMYPYAMLNNKAVTGNIFYIHVTCSDKDGDGYSIFVSGVLNEEEALKMAVEEKFFEEPEDIHKVDYVEEISLEEFLEIKGTKLNIYNRNDGIAEQKTSSHLPLDEQISLKRANLKNVSKEVDKFILRSIPLK